MLRAKDPALPRLPDTYTDERLWNARRIVESMCHSDDGHVINPLLRMSAFLPVNLPITLGMTVFGTTTASQLFWQWMNQSYNAGMNYANRNLSAEVSMADLGKSYVTATAVACGTAYGMGKLATAAEASTTLPAALRFVLPKFVPFVAVATAGACNAIAMRYKEVVDGITVRDEKGNSLGQSKVAGRKAITEVALTRVALPVPIILLPPLLSAGLKASVPGLGATLKRSRALSLALDVGLSTCCLYFALPCAIALFPQKSSIPVADLEPEIRQKYAALHPAVAAGRKLAISEGGDSVVAGSAGAGDAEATEHLHLQGRDGALGPAPMATYNKGL